MAIDKHRTLVTRLLVRSEAGDLDWKEAVQSDAFDVSFNDNSVRVRQVSKGENIAPDYEISLINEEGRIVDQFLDTELDKTPTRSSGIER